jgi:hypothetical protein
LFAVIKDSIQNVCYYQIYKSIYKCCPFPFHLNFCMLAMAD